MKNKLNDLFNSGIEAYSGIISEHPGKLLLAVCSIFILFASFSSSVDTVEQQTNDFLPDSEPVIKAFNTIDAEFPEAGGTTYTVLIETDPDHVNSTEIRDVRNPRFLRYTETISQELRSLNKASNVQSPSDLFKQIPASKKEFKKAMSTMGESRWSQSISSDYQAVKIEVKSAGLTSEEQVKLAKSIRRSIEAQPLSKDLQTSYSGQLYIDEAFQEQSQNTMNLTSILSLIGVFLVVIILFRSIYYGFNSLLTVIFGVAVGFGFYGLLGLNITPQTSGSISLGIGIAVDFGIQPIARYREEREEHDIHKSIEETLKGVITPMTIGLTAANIGFLALAVGKLTFLKDLGYLLTLTTTFAYITALTIIPASIVFYDRYLTGKTPDMDLSKVYYKVKQLK
jgi:predicted RND superfamily exporter protein